MPIDLFAESKIEEKDLFYNNIYHEILNYFYNLTKFSFELSEYNSNRVKIEALKFLYVYTSKHLDLFFNILKTYNYSMKTEISGAILILSQLVDFDKNKNAIKKLLKSPFIQDISFDKNHRFTIYSEEYGKFIFQIASYYFRNNPDMKLYMQNNQLHHLCHQHTYYISQLFESFYSITAFCEAGISGDTFLHSYTYNEKENIIIDLSHNAIFDTETFYSIYTPMEISRTLNKNIDKELKITLENTVQPEDICELFSIALYKYYLKNIGYEGPFEKAPSLK